MGTFLHLPVATAYNRARRGIIKMRENAPVAVIFDLDGTLADTLDDITDAMNVVLAEIKHRPIARTRMRSLIGAGLPVLMKLATGIDDADRIDQLVQRYQPVYADRMLRKTCLYPGVDRALDTLSAAGVPMSVLSNKPHRFTSPICDALLSRWPFVECRGHRDDVSNERRKPDPGVALELSRVMNRTPGDVVFVGDSEADIATARNAGMRSVAVTWGFRDRQDLAASDPDEIIAHPARLTELLSCG